MKLSDYLSERWVDANLKCESRNDALRKIVEMCHASGVVSEVDEPTRRLIAREEAMSTSIEPGIALPHCLCRSAERTVVSVCRCPGGVDFNAPSGEPVHLLFTILGPPDAQTTHVRLLAKIARILKQERVRHELLEAASPSSIAEILLRRDGEPR